MTITVSTDGSALGNPNGPMGWAWADHEAHAGGRPGHEHSGDCDAGGATNGTNQIGELCAVLEVLRAHPGSEPLVIETDSQYAINCSTKWVHGWKRNGWRNSQKKPVKNAVVIKAIDVELAKRPGPVKFVWVKGHAGNAGNEKVDELARTYAEDCRSGVRDGYLPREGWESLLASEYSKGTDVPADAQMLMDGKITAAEYHLGHGEDTGGVDGGGPGNVPRGGTHDGTTDEASDVAADRNESASTSHDHGATSLAQQLAGEEGVPELADFSTAPAASVTAVEDAASIARQTVPAASQSPRRVTGSGLHASGRIRITPPPSSSPSFAGGTITINGTISFTGTVDADGYMQLDGDVTIIPHGSRR